MNTAKILKQWDSDGQPDARVSDITVMSAERIIHDTMAELAQKMLAEYGVRIDQVGFKWIDCQEIDSDKPAFILQSVSIATTTI